MAVQNEKVDKDGSTLLITRDVTMDHDAIDRTDNDFTRTHDADATQVDATQVDPKQINSDCELDEIAKKATPSKHAT